METKKSNRADLEKRRLMFTQIGLIVSLALAWMVFETKSYGKQEIRTFDGTTEAIPDDLVPVTVQEKPQPIEKPKVVNMITIVDNNEEIESEIDIDVNVEEDEPIEPTVPIDIIEEEIVEEVPFIIVENMPTFPGGEKKMLEYVAKNVKYPQLAKEVGTQGRVFVSFVVEKDGSITNVTILRGIGSGCDEEAIRVVKSMPKWNPGLQCGRAVRVSCNLPINFKLQ
ncbi:MAG: TonB family protein [Bacteroidales bacterium]|nr:TonB family protein [Bacteroidales bacterium]